MPPPGLRVCSRKTHELLLEALGVAVRHREQQRLLAGEVVEEPAFADACLARDRIQREGERAALEVDLFGSVEDSVSCVEGQRAVVHRRGHAVMRWRP